MKRLFWSLLGAVLAAIGVWWFARSRMDDLYGEISRLREYEKKEQRIEAHYAAKHAAEKVAKQAELAAMTPEDRLKYRIREAEINAYIKSQIGDKLWEEVRDELTS